MGPAPARSLSLLMSLAWLRHAALGEEVITWASDAAAPADATVPTGRAAFASALQADTGPLDSKLWLFGGLTSATSFSRELWSYSLVSSVWEIEGAVGPAAAHGCQMVAVGRKLYIFGGSPALDGRMWIFDTLGQAWSSVSTGYTGRSYHTMTRIDTTLFIYGGAATTTEPQLLTFDTALGTMSQPTVVGTDPAARTEHSMSFFAHRLYLFGGITLADSTFDTAVYELDACVGCPANAWRTVSTTGTQPLARRGHTATVLGFSMFVYGGVDPTGLYLDSVYVLDLRSFRWSRPHAIGVPAPPRWGHGAILVNERIRIVAGIESPRRMLQIFTNNLFSLSRRCQGTVRLTGSEGRISMLNSQSGATACAWELFPSGEHCEVQVYFSYFSLQPTDELKVFDGDRPLPSLTGSILPGILSSTGGGLVLNFTSDTGTGDGYGFEASYRSLCSAGAAYVSAVSSCVLCSTGTVAPFPGSPCSACDDRHYADEEGLSECKACPDYSRAAAAGAVSVLECLCLPGFYRRSDSSPCEACSRGAVCEGGTMGPWPSAAGWCRDGADYYRCCGGSCPLGIDVCPVGDGAVAELGEEECPDAFSIASMSIVAFIVALSLIVAVGVCSWFLGFAAGLRKGNRLALREVMRTLGPARQPDSFLDEEVANMMHTMISAGTIGPGGMAAPNKAKPGGITDIHTHAPGPSCASGREFSARPGSGASAHGGARRLRTVPM